MAEEPLRVCEVPVLGKEHRNGVRIVAVEGLGPRGDGLLDRNRISISARLFLRP